MKLGKAHLVASLAMTAAATVYTVWSLSSPGAGVQAAAAVAPMDAPPASAPAMPSAGGGTPLDPLQIPPVPDVALDRLPEWPRNPFEPPYVEPPPPAAEAPVVEAPPPPPDLVVTTVLYSDSRRVALVNGRRVRVGDRLDGVVVAEIHPDAVVFESPVHGRLTVGRRPAGSRAGTPGGGGQPWAAR